MKEYKEFVYSPNEKLPESCECVLVSCYTEESQDYPEPMIAYVTKNKWGEPVWYSESGTRIVHVDWWMRLPEFSPDDVKRG